MSVGSELEKLNELKLLFTMLGAIAEFENDIRKDRQS